MGVVVRKKEIEEALNLPPSQGKRLIEPFKTFALRKNLPFKILEDSGVLDNEAEVHKEEGDLWLCLEGEAKFTYGGEMLDPQSQKNKDGEANEKEWKAKEIVGGTKVVLKPGDWLWIPAGEAHRHFCEGTTRLFIIKIPAK